MNPKLIEIMNSFNIVKDTGRNIVKSFLSACISQTLYSEIQGETLDEKADTVISYLNDEIDLNKTKIPLHIIIADGSSSLEYIAFLNKVYDVTVHNVDNLTTDVKIDLVLFTGGEDINPEIYYDNLGKYTIINKNRDSKERKVFDLFYGSVLFLGICRGSQMLTALSGGKLIQHVEGHGRDHSIIVNNRSRYVMTSSHHQMLFPFNLRKEDYELIAYSEFFQSNTYLNGDNEETELPIDFLEPEIVYYKNTNALCIQGHPEWSHCHESTSKTCLNLINKYLKK